MFSKLWISSKKMLMERGTNSRFWLGFPSYCYFDFFGCFFSGPKSMVSSFIFFFRKVFYLFSCLISSIRNSSLFSELISSSLASKVFNGLGLSLLDSGVIYGFWFLLIGGVITTLCTSGYAFLRPSFSIYFLFIIYNKL